MNTPKDNVKVKDQVIITMNLRKYATEGIVMLLQKEHVVLNVLNLFTQKTELLRVHKDNIQLKK